MAAIFLLCIVHTAYAQTHIMLPKPPEFGYDQPSYPGLNTGNYYNSSSSPTDFLRGAHTNTASALERQLADIARPPMPVVGNVNKPDPGQREVAKIIRELRESKQPVQQVDYNSPRFAQLTKPYTDALNELKDMLDGRKKLSLAAAYYATEQAWGNTYSTQAEFNAVIDRSADFIKKWVVQNGGSLRNNEALNRGIQKFMSESLSITTNGADNKPRALTHLPFFYDYEDFTGEKDPRNYFITKCLATGAGQCNSMPAVYLCLAEAVGAKAYLSFAPQHSLVKWPDKTGQLHGYEATSGWEITDQWYADNLFISADAIRSGIYLDTLSRRQVVANCLLDLAFGYMQKYGIADGRFVEDCFAAAVPHFPARNNINLYFIYSSYLARKLDVVLGKYRITRAGDIDMVPEAAALRDALLKNEAIIKKLGYRDMPPGMYEGLMKEHQVKGRVQQQKNVNGKEKRDLFIGAE